jgi:hypothetical protein
MKHTSGPWTYYYDRASRVWRGFRNGVEEVNQYHREELLWVIDHIDQPLLKDTYTARQVPRTLEK